MLTSYQPTPGAFDEFFGADGAVREQWSHVGTALSELGHSELLGRQADVNGCSTPTVSRTTRSDQPIHAGCGGRSTRCQWCFRATSGPRSSQG